MIKGNLTNGLLPPFPVTAVYRGDHCSGKHSIAFWATTCLSTGGKNRKFSCGEQLVTSLGR
jgi:hypothetical protein